ncbi:MAG: hypothetical protein CVV18_00130 [Gammaproteobacteria bacterium HGW-Gammaproteobacteria-8]|nr:MAG: hypothetical protein CVV18_00130 [Gammaproteobacteria bacterium HGW-Gammaproteobacteria-8]
MNQTNIKSARRWLAGAVLGALAAVATAETMAETIANDPWTTIAPGGQTRCAFGDPYTFHVRRASAEKIMLFFNGGGACWSAETCDTPDRNGGRFVYRQAAGAGSGNDPREYDGAFALDNPDNPFLDWSQVFVSYCTGDIHLGTRDEIYTRQDGSEYTVYHRGMINAQAALAWVFENFDAPERVLVSGASAGALSAPVFATRVAARWSSSDVMHWSGGSGGYRIPGEVQQMLWRRWGVLEGLPEELDAADYSAESLRILDLYRLAVQAQPRIRFHMYDTAYDAVQEQFHAWLGHPVALHDGLIENREELRAILPRLHSYIGAGDVHTLLRYADFYRRQTAGIRARDWVAAAIHGDTPPDVYCGDAEACHGAIDGTE